MYPKKIYRAGLCLMCEIRAYGSLYEMGEFLQILGGHLQNMEEAGIAISDHERLRYGHLTFETDSPEAAKLLEAFSGGPVSAEQFADAHRAP